jgi:uncharacterized protein YjbI with pentapeptide repeats
MANPEHLAKLSEDVKSWNIWRISYEGNNPDLSMADLSGEDLYLRDLSKVNLYRANLSMANLIRADLSLANLTGADLSEADLSGADLTQASLVETDLENTDLTGCRIYGISVWGIKLNKETRQTNLIITRHDEPAIKVDNLEVAQFIYLLLKYEKLRDVINSITSKAVLILGRFTPERKVVLDALADELRKRQLLPMIFDFERATSRDFTETIKVLAGMSLFVIADVTNPRSAPLELQATVPDYQIPFVPIIQEGEEPFPMLGDLAGKYHWVIRPVLTYESPSDLLQAFKEAILDRAWEKHKELLRMKAEKLETISAKTFGRRP